MNIQILTFVFLVLLTGCAASPEKLSTVAVEESVRLGKPSKPFSTFSNVELKPFTLSAGVLADAGKVHYAAVLEKKIKEKLMPLFAKWSSSTGATNRAGTLIVQPELVYLRIVGVGNRFLFGGMSGSSFIEIDLKVIDSQTNEVIAKPRVTKNANGIAGAWSIGKSDRNLLDYIAHIVHEYFSTNY